MTKLFIDLSPEEVNNQLLSKWGISLFRFAQVFAMCASDTLYLYRKYELRKEMILRKKELLISLKRYMLKKIREIEAIRADFFWTRAEDLENRITGVAKLKSFFEEYFNPRVQ